MAKLTTEDRKKLPLSAFALPNKKGGPGYPINDASHARNALSRVSESLHKGNISSSDAAKVKAKARRFLEK